jgi:hypothetical protein
MTARSRWAVVQVDLATGRVPRRETQNEKAWVLVARLSRALERVPRDAQEKARVELENRVPPRELRHQIVIILRTQARTAPPQVLSYPIVTIPSTRVPRVPPPALRHRIVIILNTPARKAPLQVLLYPTVITPSTPVRRVQPPALPLLTAISRSTRVQAA